MKQSTIDEIKQIQETQKYRYFALFDQAGTPVMPYNPNSISGDARLRQIETRLMSGGMPDGYYVVKAKTTATKTARPDEYLVTKGKVPVLAEMGDRPELFLQMPLNQPRSIGDSLKESDNVLSYESALELQTALVQLRLENQSLLRRIDELEDIIRDLEEDSVLNESPGVWENAQTFLQQLMTTATPIIDKWMDQRDKSLAIEAMKVNALSKQKPRPPRPQPAERPGEREEEVTIDVQTWILSYQDRPEIYEQIAYVYNSAEGEEDFLHNLQALDNDIFQDFLNYLQNGSEGDIEEPGE